MRHLRPLWFRAAGKIVRSAHRGAHSERTRCRPCTTWPSTATRCPDRSGTPDGPSRRALCDWGCAPRWGAGRVQDLKLIKIDYNCGLINNRMYMQNSNCSLNYFLGSHSTNQESKGTPHSIKAQRFKRQIIGFRNDVNGLWRLFADVVYVIVCGLCMLCVLVLYAPYIHNRTHNMFGMPENWSQTHSHMYPALHRNETALYTHTQTHTLYTLFRARAVATRVAALFN